jgi:hypothetical protein
MSHGSERGGAATEPSATMLRAFDVFMARVDAERMKTLATSTSPKARNKLYGRLGSFPSFREDLRAPLGRPDDAGQLVLDLAKQLHISAICEVLSLDDEIDGQVLPFSEVFHRVHNWPVATFAVLDPEHLAFFQDGDYAKNVAVLLKR